MTAAVKAWRRVLGASRVRIKRQELTKAAEATYRVDNRIVAILRPRSREEVQECVRIAAKHHVPVYPISRGKNYGYGSGAPTHDNSAILDLCLMRKMELDRDQAAISIEPGVTAVSVAEYLEKHAPGLLASLPVLTSLEASAVGNALDGGVGPGPYADRFAHVYSLEVVLGTGEIIHTGMDRFKGGALLGRTEARLGPSLRDLFMQSNLGVVTRMTIGLFPTPGDLRQLQVRVGNARQLAPLLARLKSLAHANVLTPSFLIFNDYVLIPGLLSWQYPWAPAQDRVPISRQLLEEIHSQAGPSLARYRASFELYSMNKEIGDARERAVRKSLRGFEITSLPVPRPREHVKPKGGALGLLYWRKRFFAPKDLHDVDPQRDRCGFMWCDFVMPADPALFAKVFPVLELIMRSYGFEPSIEAHTFWPRTFFLVANIAYDRDVEGEDMRAERCDAAMTAYLSEHRILPGRRRVGSMHAIPEFVDDSGPVMSRLRAAFDPADIIAPGRYERRRPPTTGSTNRIYDAIEDAHLSLIRTTSSKPAKKEKGVHPLRSRIVSQAMITKGREAIRSLLPAWSAAAHHVLTHPEWLTRLGFDETFAKVLASPRTASPILGTFEGTFNEKGELKLLQFDASLRDIEDGIAHVDGRHSSRSLSASRDDLQRRYRRVIGKRPGVIRDGHVSSLVSAFATLGIETTILSRSKIGGALGSRLSSVLADDWHALARAKGARGAELRRIVERCVTNAVSKLVHEHIGIFAVLTDPAVRLKLDEGTRTAINRHLPWTRLLGRVRTSYRGNAVDLASFVEDRRADLVLRPLRGGTAPTIVGAFVTAKTWREFVSRAIEERTHVVQERVRIEQEVFPLAVEGILHFEGCFVGTAFLVIGGEVAKPIVTRISERPKVGARNRGTFVVDTIEH